MLRTALCAGLAAALLSPSLAQAPAQPTHAELEAALLAHQVRILSYQNCRPRTRGCIKPPKRVKVRNYDCLATGTDADGGAILYCRATYSHSGGSLAGVRWTDKCVPLRAIEAIVAEDGRTRLNWEIALVEAKGRCPGGKI
jgi:hypothetical protein